VVANASFPEIIPVQAIMTPAPVTCKPEDTLDECEHLMQMYRIRRIPVVDEAGCVVGIVAQADVTRHATAEKVRKTVLEISKPGHRRAATHASAAA
jgi:CBS domain-containing protein